MPREGKDDPTSPSPGDDPYFSGKTLSNRASKLLVVIGLILALAASVGGAVLLINLAETAEEEDYQLPADTLEQVPPDPRPEDGGF